ncbi:hypothetical protein ACFV7Q_26385 [Streptomyces sp. NPDC059851]|uniref:TRADD-N-associated membrane domain-containing protein n=1 Tax=Streptomyces sp. NPDC059851 TaxID=3346971 RepID=UPI0036660111
MIVIGGVLFASLIIAAPGYVSNATKSSNLPGWVLPAITISGLILLGAAIAATVLRDRRKAATRQQEAQRLDSAASDLRKRMELASLVNFNRILLEQYHGIATKQANKSFNSSIGAMIVGLLVLVVAFIASMQFNALGERIFIGSLAALSTVFVGYLSRTFLVVYDRSLQQLNQYFNQPVLNQYFLTAERIADRLDGEQKDELLTQIAKDVLDTGKQMHEATTKPAAQPKPRSLGRQRRPQPVQQQTPAP